MHLQSALFCLNEEPMRARRGTEETKDLSLDTLDNRDDGMDVKAGKENHTRTIAQGRQRDQRGGLKHRMASLLMEDGEHKQQKRRNRVKGADNGTYEVMTHILLHTIHHPTPPQQLNHVVSG